jgi:hypothetical protein
LQFQAEQFRQPPAEAGCLAASYPQQLDARNNPDMRLRVVQRTQMLAMVTKCRPRPPACTAEHRRRLVNANHSCTVRHRLHPPHRLSAYSAPFSSASAIPAQPTPSGTHRWACAAAQDAVQQSEQLGDNTHPGLAGAKTHPLSATATPIAATPPETVRHRWHLTHPCSPCREATHASIASRRPAVAHRTY